MKKLLKIITWTFVILFGLILLAGLFTQTGLFKSYVKDFVVDELNNLLEGQVSIGEINGTLFTNLEIHNLVLSQANDTLLNVPEINLSYNPFALFNDEIRVHYLNIIEPHFYLAEDSVGTWNVTQLISKNDEPDTLASSQGEPFPFKIKLMSFILQEATANLNTTEPLIPDRVSHFNINFSGFYSDDEIRILLDSLSFQTGQPNFNLNKLAFDFTKTEEQLSLKNLSIITNSNNIQSQIQHNSTEKSFASLSSDQLDVGELEFILPDIQLKNNPDIQFSSQYTGDSLEFELTLQYLNEHLILSGLFENYLSFLDNSSFKRTRFVLNLKIDELKPQNWSDQFPKSLLNGEIILDGSLSSFQDLETTLDGRFQKTKITDYMVEDLMMQANYQSGDASGDIILRSPIANLDLQINVMNLKERLLYDGTLSVNHLNLGELVRSDTINSDLNFRLILQGEDLPSESNRLKITSEWRPSSINQIAIDTLLTEVQLIGTQYTLDTLHFQTTAGIFSGRGAGDITSNHLLHYNYQLLDLRKIARLIGADTLIADGNLAGTVYGKPDSLKNDLTLNLHNVIYDGINIDSLAGRSKLILLNSDPTLNLDIVAENFKAGSLKLDTLKVSSLLDDNHLFSEIDIQFDPNLRSDLTAELKLDSLLVLSVPEINLQFLDDDWSGKLEQVIYDPSQEDLYISGVNIQCTNSDDDRSIFAEGKLSTSGREDFKLGIRGVHPDNILRYLDIYSKVNGRMNFDLELKGTAEKPEFNGSLQFEKGAVGAVSFQDMNSWFDYADDCFNFYYSLNFNGQDSLTAEGHLPLHLSMTDTLDMLDYHKSISLDIKSESIPVSLFLQNLKAFPETSGTLLCDFTFSNTLAHPEIKGYLQLLDGKLNSPYWGIDYQDIDFKIVANDDRFSLDHFEVKTADGNMTASGEIHLEYGESKDKVIYSNMNLLATNFNLLKHRDFEILIYSDIKYQMENNKPTVGGYVNVNRSSFYLPTVLERTGYVTSVSDKIKPALIEAKERKLESNQTQLAEVTEQAQIDTIEVPGFLDLLEGELEVRVNRNTWIRNPQLRLELGGNLRMIVDKGNFLLKGPVTIIRGQYDLLGRRFIVNEGKVEFLWGEAIKSPFYLEAEYVYRTVGRAKRSLVVEVTGNLEYPVINFRENNNPISEDDAISIVLYGRKKDDLSFGTQSDMAEMGGGTAALGYVSNLVSDRLTRSVGDDLSLDVVEVNATDNWQKANFVVGKYITENIFVTYKREFGQNMDNNLNPETISMEYEIQRNFFFQMIQGNPQESGYDLLLRFNWD
jgi:translocation and assembly module TamB